MKLLNKEEFDKLTQNEKRVAICRDVIARIDAQKIQPNHGYFFNGKEEVYENVSVPVQEQINNTTCSVCAKGAIFCSWVGNFNNVDHTELKYANEDVYTWDRHVPELMDIFGREMLDNLEAAFEGDVYNWHYDGDVTRHYARAFYDYDLRGIMEYIIANGGEFPLPTSYIKDDEL